VSAHIISDSPQGRYKVTEERFTSLCYAGHLPGYTMNYNHHGLVFSINTLSANKLNSGKTRKILLSFLWSVKQNLIFLKHFQPVISLQELCCRPKTSCKLNKFLETLESVLLMDVPLT
jgi:Acyl-coenzyme A:6-aminopenicillanic acid acyl-transferase